MPLKSQGRKKHNRHIKRRMRRIRKDRVRVRVRRKETVPLVTTTRGKNKAQRIRSEKVILISLNSQTGRSRSYKI